MEAPVRFRSAVRERIRASMVCTWLPTASTSWFRLVWASPRSWTRSGLFGEVRQGPVVIESIRCWYLISVL